MSERAKISQSEEASLKVYNQSTFRISSILTLRPEERRSVKVVACPRNQVWTECQPVTRHARSQPGFGLLHVRHMSENRRPRRRLSRSARRVHGDGFAALSACPDSQVHRDGRVATGGIGRRPGRPSVRRRGGDRKLRSGFGRSAHLHRRRPELRLRLPAMSWRCALTRRVSDAHRYPILP